MAEDTYPLQDGCRTHDQFWTTTWKASVLVGILRQYFGQDDRITLEKAKLIWDEDRTKSMVQIDTVDNLKFEESGKKPAILVDFEAQQFPRDVIGDMQDYTGTEGRMEMMNRNVGAMLIECWALKKMESYSIADEIRYFLQAYRHPIAKAYGFNTLRVAQVAKAVKYRQFDDYWITRAVIEFEQIEQWGVGIESLKVSKFGLALNEIAPPRLP